MDPSRKRKTRLVVALTCALLLAAALVYTSFSAASEARQPSQLAGAEPGETYQLTGRVARAPGSTRARSTRSGSRTAKGGGAGVPVRYVGQVPDPFREGREIIIDVRRQGAVVRGPAGLARDQVPVEVLGRAQDLGSAMAAAGLALPDRRAGDLRLRHRRLAVRRARRAARRTSPRAAAPSTRWPACSSSALAILEAAFVRSDFSFALVASHSCTTTPLFYRLTAVWSSQEGSLLLWVLLLALWSSAILFLTRSKLREVAPYATAVLLGFGAFFCAAARVPRVAVHHAGGAAGRGRRPEPAAAPPEHDDPPADALLGLHAVRGPVRVRDRRADHAAGSARSGSAARGRSRSAPGCSSASGSCSAHAGPTWSWAGAATGRGTRWRTPR